VAVVVRRILPWQGRLHALGIVSENSQLNGLIPSPGSQFFGYVHSPGTEALGFSGPSVMDAGSVPNKVISLLNTAWTNSVYYNLLNP
jgi:hypothetical protein